MSKAIIILMKNNLVIQVACVVTSVMQNVIVEIVFLKCAVTYLTCTNCHHQAECRIVPVMIALLSENL